MKVGLTFDQASDYGIEEGSMVFADFCYPGEVEWMAGAIKRIGFTPVLIGNMYRLNEMIKSDTLDCDIIIVCDEGIMSRNREAIVPAICELNKIPYIGSDAYCMGLSQNKYHSKLVAESLGIRCPKGIYVEYDPNEAINCDSIKYELGIRNLNYPLIVKPNEEGYSMGVFIVRSDKELAEAIRYNFENYKEPVLVEEFISGRELFIPVIGNGKDAYTLPVGAVMAEGGADIELFSLEEKHRDVFHYEIATLSDEVKRKISDSALKLYRHMLCHDFGRLDFRLDKDGEPVLIEINPRPGLMSGGPFELCAREIGRTYDEVLKEIILNGAARYGIKE